jgi:hypothetical protein
MVRTIRYRVGQFLQALTAGVPEAEVEQAIRILPPRAQRLFRHQAVQDQRHAMAVYHALRQAGHKNPQLLAAGLLHDAGKAAARIPAWQRAVIVLLERFAPRLLAWLSQEEPQGCVPSLSKGCVLSLPKDWRRPFVIHARHPQAGARWAEEAGCSPLTVALIRRHQDQLIGCSPLAVEEDQLLAALQAADNLH